MQQERRASPRKDLMRIGEMFFDHARLSVNCIVRNYSDAGALIEVRSTENIPDKFRLTVESVYLSQFCRVVRRTKHMLGVRFVA